MKTLIRLLGLIVLLAALALPGAAFAQDGEPQDQIVLGSNYTLQAGESVRNLNVFGGNAVLEAGSLVTDHVFLFGGNLVVKGTVNEDIHVYGGQLTLADTALVKGDVAIAGGNVTREAGSQVNGSVNSAVTLPFGIPIPTEPVITVPRYGLNIDPMLQQGFWYVIQTVGLAALAMLVVLFAPKVTERAGDTAVARPLAAGGIGLLIAIVTPPLLIGFAITVIGIPVTLILIAVIAVVLTFGWITLGLEVGKRLSQAFHREWPAVVNAGLGTFLLALVANGIGFTPCVGWIVPAVIGFIGMGGVVLSRFGTLANPAPAAPATPVAA